MAAHKHVIGISGLALVQAGKATILGAQIGGSMTFDQDLDCAGLLCPLPVLKARKRMIGMAPGAVLRVLATDRMAEIDLPHFCVQAGHEYLGCTPHGTAIAHFLRCGRQDIADRS